MKQTETEKINQFLEKEDPYTFAMLALDMEAGFEESGQKTELLFEAFEDVLRRNLSSGAITVRFEEDVYLAFAPFVLDKTYLMKVFDRLQQEYSELIKKDCPERKTAVAIGCVTGKQKTTLEQLSETAEKLVAALRKQGKHGYKIMEQN